MTEVRYSHPTAQSRPAYSFGKAASTNASTVAPGPGAYDTPDKF